MVRRSLHPSPQVISNFPSRFTRTHTFTTRPFSQKSRTFEKRFPMEFVTKLTICPPSGSWSWTWLMMKIPTDVYATTTSSTAQTVPFSGSTTSTQRHFCTVSPTSNPCGVSVSQDPPTHCLSQLVITNRRTSDGELLLVSSRRRRLLCKGSLRPGITGKCFLTTEKSLKSS